MQEKLDINVKELLEAGVHLGHQRKKWNPKMKPYIYEDKNGVNIINLDKTAEAIEVACNYLKQVTSQKKNVVFVATKKHISDVVRDEAIRAGAYYINRRWLGGMLTNFDTIRVRLNRLKEIEEMRDTGALDKLNKKELSVINKEFEKLDKTLGGIKNMRGKPEVLFVVDGAEEDIAVKEAKKVNLTVIGLIDTNTNPAGIDILIPGNDDSARSVGLITKYLADAMVEGYGGPGQVPQVHNTNKPKNIMRPPTRIVQELTVPVGEGSTIESQELTTTSNEA